MDPLLVQRVKRAKARAVPLLGISTPDPAATLDAIRAAWNGSAPPLLQWDCIRGMVGLNDEGRAVLAAAFPDGGEQMMPHEAVHASLKFKAHTVLVVHNAQRYLDDILFVQAAWNCRDPHKSTGRMLLLLGPSLKAPAELANDLLIFDEQLPTKDALRAVVRKVEDSPDCPIRLDDAQADAAAETLVGLSAFAAEQATALALTRHGLDPNELRQRTRQLVSQTEGLEYMDPKAGFDAVAGYDNIKRFIRCMFTGRRPPKLIAFVDEIEKAFAGATAGTSDSSGVSQGMLGTMLTHMQETEARGLLFIGHPGTAKSAVAKAAAAEFGCPAVWVDLAGMKGGIVGESERNIRAALKVVQAIGQGSTLWIATCNRVADLPPALRRRYKRGTFVFDLPSRQERRLIWTLYGEKYAIGVADDELPDDEGWTGAEIESCVEVAWELDLSIRDAASYIVPISRAAPDEIAALRRQADGRYLSASFPGVYHAPGRDTTEPEQGARRMDW